MLDNFLLAILLLILPFYTAISAPYSAEFRGVSVQFAENIPQEILQNSHNKLKNYLEKHPDQPTDQELHSLVKQIPEIVEESAKPFGYFHTKCNAKFYDKKPQRIEIECQLGPEIKIEEVLIEITGPGQNRIQQSLAHQSPDLTPGTIFTANRYERAKQELLILAYEQGYINANTNGSRLTIDTDSNTARVVMALQTNDAFTFGPIEINQDAYDKTFIRELASFKDGDHYQAKLLHEYQNTLQYTGLFTLVSIRPSLADRRKSDSVPIFLQYEPIQKIQYRFGFGYNSDTHLNTSLGLTRNRLGNRGEKINSEFRISSRKTVVESSLYIPRTHPKFDFYNFEVQYTDETIIDENHDQSVNLSANYNKTRHLNQSHIFDQQFSFIYAIDWSKAENEPTLKTQVIYPRLHYLYMFKSPDRSVMASLGTELSGNIKFFLSNISFMKATLFSNIRTSEIHNFRLIVKNKFGLIISEDTLPLGWYFRTGGTYTVRGFEYDSIGETELPDNKMLFTHTTELQRKIVDSIFAAGFFDCGNASHNVFTTPTSQALGTGLVWESPFGDIELSIAWPIENYSITQNKYKLHIALKKGFY